MSNTIIENLKEKLKSGDLSEEDVEELQQYIEGLRSTAEFLQQEANNLENKLEGDEPWWKKTSKTSEL